MLALLATLSVALLTASSPAFGQEGFFVDVRGGARPTLAVAAPSQDPTGVGAEVRDAIDRNLGLTGWFEMQPLNTHLEKGGGAAPGAWQPEPWRTLRTAALVRFQMRDARDPLCGDARVCLDLYVYDVAGGRPLASRRLRAPEGQHRALAHAAANQALEALTGKRGHFGALMVAVRDVGGNKEIHLVGLDGGDVRPVTRNGSINLSPTWAPGGQRIAWTSYRRGEADLFVKDLQSGDVRALSARPGAEIGAAFSPDGRYVAVALATGDDTDLLLLDARTGELVRRLTQGGGIDVSPAFSPDGSTLAFASERSGGSQIFTIPVDGGTPTRVTRTGGFFTDPAWSPDGSRLAFVRRAEGRFDVLTARPDGSGLVRITEKMGDNEDPAWTPDGRHLVFSSTRDGSRKLWISTADGRHQAPITTTSGWSQPSFAP